MISRSSFPLRPLLRLLIWAMLSAIGVAAQGIITTIAGTDFSFPPTPLSALSAPLGKVDGIAVDTSGNVYASDPDNNLILKITRDGVVNIVAGNRIAGFSGDGGPATSASIFAPGGVAVDAQGNIFFADTGNNRVRKVTPGGIISTVAGTGVYSFSGDGGPAINAALNVAAAVAVDASGNLFIVDRANARIRKVAPDGIITTFAGNGTLGFSGDGGLATSAMLNQPGSVAVDSNGNLFITDESNCRVRKVTPQGIITTVAGNGSFTTSGDGGPALSAGINQPIGLTVDSAGRIYIVEPLGNRVRRVSTDGTIATIAGNGSSGFDGDGGPAAAASLNEPQDVAVDASGNVFIADTYNSRVRRVSTGNLIDTVAGNGQFQFAGDNGPATSAALSGPLGVAVDAGGNVFLADTTNSRIRRISPDGTITTVVGTGACCFGGDGGQ